MLLSPPTSVPLLAATLAVAVCVSLIVLARTDTTTLSTLQNSAVLQYIHKSLPLKQDIVNNHDYYAQPGMLQVDRSNKDQHRIARWIPYHEWEALAETKESGLEADVELGDGFDLLEAITAAVKDSTVAAEAKLDGRFDYLYNKTILLLGDSVDRGAIDYACDLLHGTLSVRQFLTAPQDLRKGSTNKLGDPHHCQLPALFGNTTLWSWMTYGSITDEHTFDSNLGNLHPKMLEARVELIANRLGNYSVTPDMVLMHTIMWDLNAANIVRAQKSMKMLESLELDFLLSVKHQLPRTLEQADRLFPMAKKIYRILHHTRADKGLWWQGSLPKTAKPIERIPYGVNKGEQINTIVREILPDYGVTAFDMKHVLQGYLADFRDAIHPGPVGRTMYTQMLLYYLKTLQ